MFENMSKRTKMMLSLVGVSAVMVPALLLLFASSRTQSVPEVSDTKRTIDQSNLEKSAKKVPVASPVALPSPASPSATPKVQEASPGAQ